MISFGFIEPVLLGLYGGMIDVLANLSVEVRLAINTIVIILTLHLLVKRLIELRRRDSIFPFRVILIVLLTLVLTFSIPVEWYLYSLWIGEVNEHLLNLARIAGGLVVIALVATLEVIDVVIYNINRRAKSLEEQEQNFKDKE